jgi:excisionase family DNA binding protein
MISTLSAPLIQPEVLTLDEVAAYLRLSPDIVQRQATQGLIPGRKIEEGWRFLKSAIDHWLLGQDPRTTLLQQAGVLANDVTLAELRHDIYQQRGRSEVELDTPNLDIPA